MIGREVIHRTNYFTFSEIARCSKDDNRTRFTGTRNRFAGIHKAALMTRKKGKMATEIIGRAKISARRADVSSSGSTAPDLSHACGLHRLVPLLHFFLPLHAGVCYQTGCST